jgi:polygalacturonase
MKQPDSNENAMVSAHGASRRKLLATIGALSVTAMSAGLLSGTSVFANPNNPNKGANLGNSGIDSGLECMDWISVTDYGAVGDGVADDTAAIQQAFNDAGPQGAVYFPAGVYLVSPSASNGYILTLSEKKSFSLLGQGAASIIKVKSNSGNYKGIIGLYNSNEDVKSLYVTGLTFDHNRQQNILAATADYEAQLRATISNYSSPNGYEQIEIHHCSILNTDSVVSFYFPKGLGNGKLVKIDACTWLSCGNANGSDIDQSFINATCDTMHVTNCTFQGESWSHAPRTAIEPHASNCIVANNTVAYFQVGANITGISQTGTTVNMVCSDNTFQVSRDGILIWSQSLAPANATIGFKNCIVSGNTLNIDATQYNFLPYPADAAAFRSMEAPNRSLTRT